MKDWLTARGHGDFKDLDDRDPRGRGGVVEDEAIICTRCGDIFSELFEGTFYHLVYVDGELYWKIAPIFSCQEQCIREIIE